ncbi:RNA 2'-phosphotransferase [Burkholderia metallica]
MSTQKKNELPAPDAIEVSRYLSYLLRHAPQTIGLRLDPEGWADIDELIAGAARHGHRLDRATLETVCATNDKQRFALSHDGRRIRAVQGHSTPVVQRRYPPAQPPERLYHGAATRFLDSIRAQGLKPGARHHVHLSPDMRTALAVGARYGVPVILAVDAQRMHRQGHTFHVAENGVWLTDAVPAEFLTEMDTPAR